MSKTTTTPRTAHITRAFRAATPEQAVTGLAWYVEANNIAKGFSADYAVTVPVAAGIIAALSPINSWGANVSLAERFLAAGGLHTGYLGGGLAKGRAILAGADIESTLNGNKTVSFFHAIATAGKTDYATIDRHAYSAAINTRTIDLPHLSNKRYAEFVETYRRAAKILSEENGYTITTSETQATVWIAYRAKHWSKTAFNVKTI